MTGRCKTCKGTGNVDDGFIYGSGGVEYENGPVKCVKDCPDCADARLNDFLESSVNCILGAVADVSYAAQCMVLDDRDAVSTYECKQRDLVKIIKSRITVAWRQS